LEQLTNIKLISVTNESCAAPGRVKFFRETQLLNVPEKVVVEVDTVLGSVIDVIDLQPLNILLKLVHTFIDVGKLTEVKDVQLINNELTDETLFRVEGNVILFNALHPENVD
jgi:hypothetical protein